MNILMGITGSIAAYKSLDLIRLFEKAGHKTAVILTKGGSKFVPVLSLKTFTSRGVYIDQFDENTDQPIHINLARWADIFIISPASLDIIGKMANGIADNLLLSTFFAFDKKVVIVPAMNDKMYAHPMFKKNLVRLKKLGIIEIPPRSGALASYDVAKGHTEESSVIFEEVLNLDKYSNKFKGKNILITAGGSSEDIDPVRVISNRSTGEMGRQVALAFYRQGAEVSVISSKNISLPTSIKIISATSLDDYFKAVKKMMNRFDIYVSSAALSDFVPKKNNEKIKKEKFNGTLKLENGIDILSYVLKNKKKNQIIVGFAAETNLKDKDIEKKLKRKPVDYLFVNEISEKYGFGDKLVNGYIIHKNKKVILSDETKGNAAFQLTRFIVEG